MKVDKTYEVKIYLGFKDTETGTVYSDNLALNTCRDYCDEVGLCVTITPTKFAYTGGWEPGCIVGLINYPRFKSKKHTIFNHALNLAKLLKKEYNQKRVSILTPTQTFMMEDNE
jgi:hypothetical protein